MKLFKNGGHGKDDASSSPWPAWRGCSNHPRTASFRSGEVFKTVNPAYLSPARFSGELTAEHAAGGETEEAVTRGMRSERLFFDPGETHLVLDETASFLKKSVPMSVESRDPFTDFRVSMGEMVEAHRLKDWDSLEELLRGYLKVNAKPNHDFIVGAFVDLLVTLAADNSNRHRASPVSPLSFYTSSESSSSSSTAITTPRDGSSVA